MIESIKPDFDVRYTVLSFQELYALDRHVFALRFITGDGQKIIVELPDQGARLLRDKMLEAFEAHPEMEDWGKDWKPH